MASRPMTDSSNRTFVCSVVFLDIVEYSKRSVTEQLKLKQRFNAMLSNALQQVAVIDRIVLDTGDGAAISFLGNPDDSLFVTMKLRDAIAGENPNEMPPLLVRIGINLGPVRLIKDINGQLNIIGDGINVAQRVMSFAEPGRILVSRSYYEVVSRMSDDYGQMFRYEGTRTDKHVREHSVYAVAPTAREAASPTPAIETPRAKQRPEMGQPPLQVARTLHARTGIRPRLLFGSLAVGLAIVVAGFAVRAERVKIAKAQLMASKQVQESPPQAAPAATSVNPPPASPAAPVPPVASVQPAQPAAKAASPKPPESAASHPHTRETAPAASAQNAAPAAKTREKPADAGKAAVRLVVVPWGEIYIDGQKKGISPPLRVIAVPPGRHVVEIRNANLPPHRETIDVKAGDVVRLHHRF